jgi:cell division septum initiation protein DivIVA
LTRLAADVEGWVAENMGLRDELDRVKAALTQWQSDTARNNAGQPGAGQNSARLAAQPSVEAVSLLSRAQQQADSLLAEAYTYAQQVVQCRTCGTEDLGPGSAQPGNDRRTGAAARAGDQRPPPPQLAVDGFAHTVIV